MADPDVLKNPTGSETTLKIPVDRPLASLCRKCSYNLLCGIWRKDVRIRTGSSLLILGTFLGALRVSAAGTCPTSIAISSFLFGLSGLFLASFRNGAATLELADPVALKRIGLLASLVPTFFEIRVLILTCRAVRPAGHRGWSAVLLGCLAFHLRWTSREDSGEATGPRASKKRIRLTLDACAFLTCLYFCRDVRSVLKISSTLCLLAGSWLVRQVTDGEREGDWLNRIFRQALLRSVTQVLDDLGESVPQDTMLQLAMWRWIVDYWATDCQHPKLGPICDASTPINSYKQHTTTTQQRAHSTLTKCFTWEELFSMLNLSIQEMSIESSSPPLASLQSMLASMNIDKNAKPSVDNYRTALQNIPPCKPIAVFMGAIRRAPALLSFLFLADRKETACLFLLPLAFLEMTELLSWTDRANVLSETSDSMHVLLHDAADPTLLHVWENLLRSVRALESGLQTARQVTNVTPPTELAYRIFSAGCDVERDRGGVDLISSLLGVRPDVYGILRDGDFIIKNWRGVLRRCRRHYQEGDAGGGGDGGVLKDVFKTWWMWGKGEVHRDVGNDVTKDDSGDTEEADIAKSKIIAMTAEHEILEEVGRYTKIEKVHVREDYYQLSPNKGRDPEIDACQMATVATRQQDNASFLQLKEESLPRNPDEDVTTAQCYLQEDGIKNVMKTTKEMNTYDTKDTKNISERSITETKDVQSNALFLQEKGECLPRHEDQAGSKAQWLQDDQICNVMKTTKEMNTCDTKDTTNISERSMIGIEHDGISRNNSSRNLDGRIMGAEAIKPSNPNHSKRSVRGITEEGEHTANHRVKSETHPKTSQTENHILARCEISNSEILTVTDAAENRVPNELQSKLSDDSSWDEIPSGPIVADSLRISMMDASSEFERPPELTRRRPDRTTERKKTPSADRDRRTDDDDKRDDWVKCVGGGLVVLGAAIGGDAAGSAVANDESDNERKGRAMPMGALIIKGIDDDYVEGG